MIDLCPVGRAGTPDEVGTVGALLMGPDGAFITGSDFLMDGGVTDGFLLVRRTRAEVTHNPPMQWTEGSKGSGCAGRSR
jgi:hypothetical protein